MPALQSNVRLTFPKYRRIAEQAEFKALLNSGRRSCRWFVVYSRRTENAVSRLGMVVSKRVEHKACARNYVKRLIREEFRHTVPGDLAVNMVVRVKQRIRKTEGAQVRRELAKLLREVNNAPVAD